MNKDNVNSPNGFWSLWVGHLPEPISKEELIQQFEPFGKVVSVKIIHGKHYGFVNFLREEDATKAFRSDSFAIRGSKIKVKTPVFKNRDEVPTTKDEAPVKEVEYWMSPFQFRFFKTKGNRFIKEIEKELKVQISFESEKLNKLVITGENSEVSKVGEKISSLMENWSESIVDVNQKIFLFSKKMKDFEEKFDFIMETNQAMGAVMFARIGTIRQMDTFMICNELRNMSTNLVSFALPSTPEATEALDVLDLADLQEKNGVIVEKEGKRVWGFNQQAVNLTGNVILMKSTEMKIKMMQRGLLKK